MTKILVFAGSARSESLNKKLARAAAEQVREHGAEVTLVDPRDYTMPLYDGDLEAEQGIPEPARKLRALMQEQDGLLLVCPEYNSSITPLLKNTIDWISRPDEGVPSLVAFRGKVAALASASPGGLGGMRGLVHVRSILGNIGVLVVPSQVTVPKAHEAFADDGSIADERVAEKLSELARELVDTARKHRS